MAVAIALAVIADILFAASGVLQQNTASQLDYSLNLKLKLISKLFADRKWFIGFLFSIIGYIISFVALDFGSLVLVESLMILNFLIALPISNIVKKIKFNLKELVYSLLTVLGLILFLVVSDSKDSIGSYTPSRLLLSVAIFGLITVLGLYILKLTKSINLRTFWLAATGSLMNTLLALEIKQIISSLDLRGHMNLLATVFEAPGTYLLVPTFLVALLLIQSAFQSEKLSWSLPTINLINPVATTAIAVILFNSTISSSFLAVILETIGIISVTWGILMLSTDNAKSENTSMNNLT